MLTMKKIVFIFSLSLIGLLAYNQSSSNTLMKIDDREISSEEFLRVYNKNNNITPESEKKSIDEYVDLFVNYKLKVIEAENRGYDTITTFIDEFSGYRDQLAKPYFQNEAIKEALVKEAYERSKHEVSASHILIRCDANSSPKDTLKAFSKLASIRARIVAGESFSEVAKATSDDPSVKDNGGELGYFSVFRMVYPFESAAFNTPVGNVSKPIRTQFGYHIIKVNAKRPSRGSVKVAHIMTRIAKGASAPEKKASKEKIDEAYSALMNGENWKTIVHKYSENPRTVQKDGEIGWLNSGQAPEDFLNSCHSLDSGKFSKPIETEGGYHIAYILDKKSIESYEEAQEKLSRRIDNDELRKKALKDMMNSEMINKYGMLVNSENANELLPLLDSSIYDTKWNAELAKDLKKPVLIIGTKEYSQSDFAIHLAHKKFSSAQSFENILSDALSNYSDKVIKAYAMKMLPTENPDYKYLLQEYHDGILLFNLTNELVWQLAQEDTLGLNSFYKEADKYNWEDRIEVAIYEYEDNSFTSKLPKLAKKQTKKNLNDEYLLSNLCPTDSTPCIHSTKKIYEKGQDAITEKFTWERNSYTTISDEGKNYLYYVVKVIPAQAKKLEEARGLYVADYQSHLESEWISELREKYMIEINNDVLDKLKSELN